MNITDTKKLGEYIKKMRKAQHLTQADLAIAALELHVCKILN